MLVMSSFSFFPQKVLPYQRKIAVFDPNEPFLKQQILDSSKLKEFADKNFKFKNGRELTQQEENTVGTEKLLVTSIFSVPTVFSEDFYCRHVKTRAYLGKG